MKELIKTKIDKYEKAFNTKANIIIIDKNQYDNIKDLDILKDFEIVTEENIKSPIIFKK